MRVRLCMDVDIMELSTTIGLEKEIYCVLNTVPSKVMRQMERDPRCLCTAPEADDLLKDLNGNNIGYVSVSIDAVSTSSNDGEQEERQEIVRDLLPTIYLAEKARAKVDLGFLLTTAGRHVVQVQPGHGVICPSLCQTCGSWNFLIDSCPSGTIFMRNPNLEREIARTRS
jgi:hypothetical protein